MDSIPLSEFSGVRGSGHARLYIKASDSGPQTVVSEKLGSRILTRLGKLPLLRNTESVQERRNAGMLLQERTTTPGERLRRV
ncbi:hypothetical protein ESCOMA231M_19975 [Escherichia coli]|nr:Secreted effector protein sptP [Escherichia coli]CAD5743789.1 Secreted effector protein sptP [Escherichia coli]